MGTLNKTVIENYVHLIEENKTNFGLVKSAFSANVQDIGTDLDAISFDYWEDDLATSLSDYKTSLKNGVVSKLNSSLATNGTYYYLDALITDLEEKCQNCLNFISGAIDLYRHVCLSSTGDSFEYKLEPTYNSVEHSESTIITSEEDVISLNTELQNQFAEIEDTLSKIHNLKFDDVIDYELGTNTPFEFPEVPEVITTPIDFEETPSIVSQQLIINQGDQVKVFVQTSEDEEGSFETMFYLGTDSKGRSYFAESMEPDALVYRAVLPNVASTGQTYLNDTENLGDPLLGSSYAEARIAFVIFGGNTGDIVVKNILSYPNGAYTGDANFNTSLVYDDSSIAPEVVSTGDNEYDPNNAYHMVYYNPDECVSLSAIYDEKSTDLSDHPTIVLKPGEKITTKYGGIFGWDFTKEKYDIGSDDSPTYLVWDDTKNCYYVVDGNGGYYTSTRYGDYGRGHRYVTIDSLFAGDTQVNIK